MREAIFFLFIVRDVPDRADCEASWRTFLLWRRWTVQHFMYFYLYLCGPIRMRGSQPSLQFQNTSRGRAPGTTVSVDDSMQVQGCLTHRRHSRDTYSATGGQTLERQSCRLERRPGKMKVRATEWEMHLVLKSCRSSLSKQYNSLGSRLPPHRASKFQKNALSFTILLETFLLA